MSHNSLDTVGAFLLDLDGVLLRGMEPLPGAAEFIDILHATGTPFLVMTNNATSTPEQVAGRLNGMGVAVRPEDVYSSALATVGWLRQRYPAGSRVLYVGEAGIRIALAGGGFELVDSHRDAEVVVTALDRTITYRATGRGGAGHQCRLPFCRH